MRAALLIIDMQNDFVRQGSPFEVDGIRDGLEGHGRFIDACRKKGVTIIYTRHCYDPEKNPVEAAMFPKLADGGLRRGTEGWQICDELRPGPDDMVIDKTRYDAFFGTALRDFLVSRGIDTVIITGTITNVCCESTARSAMFNDYNVLFCSDLNYCSREESHRNTLKVINHYFGKVLDSKAILEAIGG